MPLAERIARRTQIDPVTGCHNWIGYRQADGYGRIGMEASTKHLRVHRAAYELAHGPVPDGLVIDHLCRNRACCNPEHLEAVTFTENVRRGVAPSNLRAQANMCARGHEFVEGSFWRSARGKRTCKACARLTRALLKAIK